MCGRDVAPVGTRAETQLAQASPAPRNTNCLELRNLQSITSLVLPTAGLPERVGPENAPNGGSLAEATPNMQTRRDGAKDISASELRRGGWCSAGGRFAMLFAVAMLLPTLALALHVADGFVVELFATRPSASYIARLVALDIFFTAVFVSIAIALGFCCGDQDFQIWALQHPNNLISRMWLPLWKLVGGIQAQMVELCYKRSSVVGGTGLVNFWRTASGGRGRQADAERRVGRFNPLRRGFAVLLQM